MSQDLKPRQKAILQYIEDKIRADGYPPSVREIGEAVGLKSSSTVHSHLLKLEDMGYIKRDPTKGRAVIPVHMIDESQQWHAQRIPLVGKVAAGTPITAQENIEDYITIPEELMGSGNYFLLRVQGNSMIAAGILDGDHLIVRQQADAANGEIVVAMIDNEATVKRLYRYDEYIELRPENSTMKPIKTRNVTILGKVTGLLRQL